MAEKLTEKQLLLLNNLIYRREFTEKKNEDLTVGEILNTIISKEDGNSAQQTMTPEEWDAVYEIANGDNEIKNLQVTHMNYEKETGAKMACFVDESGQAYAVFAGTGANEWRDDCVAGTMTDSPQQVKAKEWIESTGYDDIIVSGHSKGGNKAMYVTVVTDCVSECYAFDGEGFSQEFCEKYEEQIREKKSSIHLTASYRDFVNVLLITVAGDVYYVENDIGVADASQYHSPDALFMYDSSGDIVYDIGNGGSLSQDPAMEMLHGFTLYMIENATEAEKVVVLSVIGELLTKFLAEKHGGVVRNDILETFGVEGGEIALRYLTEYLQELQVNNPEIYGKYRDAFGNYVGDAADNFWFFLLGEILIEPISEDLVFDNLTNGSILMIYRASEFFMGGNVVGRDFSESAKEALIGAAKESEDEAWWRVDRWDCWYRVENFFGQLNLDNYTANVDEYYRKLIDINDASVRDIEKIFAKVGELDSTYATKMKQQKQNLDSNVMKILKNVSSIIVPLAQR